MRGLVPGLASAHPVGAALPAIYHDDGKMQDFVLAFDESLAPVIAVLDNLAAYLDPLLAPVDFVGWLAGWVGLAVDDDWPPARRRELVARTVELYRWRGTARGLREAVALHSGTECEIVESGGVAWSAVTGGELPGTGDPLLTVRVRPPDGVDLDLRRLDSLVEAAKPAHLAHRIEVIDQ